MTETVTSQVLEGCCIHVWQRVDGDVHAHAAVNAKIRALGAKTAPRLNKDVTHVIFQRKLQSTANERSAEDGDLREIYNKVGKAVPPVFVVSPLWLQHSQDTGTRAKEARYLERKPPDPIFLVASPNKLVSANLKRKRKSLAPRPRELVEVADVDDAIFSSSQQIRDLSGTGAGGGAGAGVRGFRSFSDPEDEGPEDPPPKAPSLFAAPALKAGAIFGARKPSAPGGKAATAASRPQQAAPVKSTLRQLPLSFAVISKRPPQQHCAGSVAVAGEAQAPAAAEATEQQEGPAAVAAAQRRTAGQTPKPPAGETADAAQGLQTAAMDEMEAQEQGAARGGRANASEMEPEPLRRRRSTCPEGQPSARKKPCLAPSPRPQPQEHAAAGQAGSAAEAPQAQRYPALPCTVVSHGTADTTGLTRAPSLTRTSSRVTFAEPGGGGTGGEGAGGNVAQRHVSLYLPPKLPAPDRPPTAGEKTPAAGAAAAANAAAAAAAAFAAATGLRSGARRGSRGSVSGTPLGPAPLKGKALVTPAGTPQGITPVMVPRLKSQGSGNPESGSANATPEAGPSAPHYGAAVAAVAAAAQLPTSAAKGSRRGSAAAGDAAAAQASGPEAQLAAAQAAGPLALPQGSVRRSGRSRAGLPPTPPPIPGAAAFMSFPLAGAVAVSQPATDAARRQSGITLALQPAPSCSPGGGGASATPTLHVAGGRRRSAAVPAASVGPVGDQDGGATPSMQTGAGRHGSARKRQQPTPLLLSPVVVCSNAPHSGGAVPTPQGADGVRANGAGGASHAAAEDAGAAAAGLGQTPGSALRRSSRLAGYTPLALAPVAGRSPKRRRQETAQATGNAQPQAADADAVAEQGQPQQQQQPAVPAEVQVEEEGYLAGGSGAERGLGAPSAAVGKTPATARKRRRRQQDGTEAGAVDASDQGPLSAAAILPSPALCTRARVRTAATPHAASAAAVAQAPAAAPAAQEQRQQEHPQAAEEQGPDGPPQQQQPGTPTSPARGQAVSHVSGTPFTSPKYYTRLQRRHFRGIGVDLERVPPGQPFTLQPDGSIALENDAAADTAAGAAAGAAVAAVATGATCGAQAGLEEAAAGAGPADAGARTVVDAERHASGLLPASCEREPPMALGLPSPTRATTSGTAAPSPGRRPGSTTRSRRRALDWELACAAQLPGLAASQGTAAAAPLLVASANGTAATTAPSTAGARGPAVLQAVPEEEEAVVVESDVGTGREGSGALEKRPRRTSAARRRASAAVAAVAASDLAAAASSRRTGSASAQKPRTRPSLAGEVPRAVQTPAPVGPGRGRGELAAAAAGPPLSACAARAATTAGEAAPVASLAAGPPQKGRLSLRKQPLAASSAAPQAPPAQQFAGEGQSAAHGLPPKAVGLTGPSAGSKRSGRAAGIGAASPCVGSKRRRTVSAAPPIVVEAAAAAEQAAHEPLAAPPTSSKTRRAGSVMAQSLQGAGGNADEALAERAGRGADLLAGGEPAEACQDVPTAIDKAAHGAKAAGAVGQCGSVATATATAAPADSDKLPTKAIHPFFLPRNRGAVTAGGAAAAATASTQTGKASRGGQAAGKGAAKGSGKLVSGFKASLSAAIAEMNNTSAGNALRSLGAGAAATRSGALPSGSLAVAPTASGATASTGVLGQYPRGREHPLRAGVKYLAHTCVDAAVAATIQAAVKQLGSARLCTPGYEDGHITHLVLGPAPRRTVKVLLGIANGALLVTPAWVTDSLAAGCWLPEEGYIAQGAFATTAAAVRTQLQAAQQSGAGAALVALASPRAGVAAKPLSGRQVAVHAPQCSGLKLADVQARKADVEKLVAALGGRIVPVRSAALLVVVGGPAGASERRPRVGGVAGPAVQLASEEWLMKLAETHVWQEPPPAH